MEALWSQNKCSRSTNKMQVVQI
uniref:Uncharacterized protein n=1 Tax=Anguilla anguilla TaxID=7936 RepID=A0A0E9Q5T1_ANGAN